MSSMHKALDSVARTYIHIHVGEEKGLDSTMKAILNKVINCEITYTTHMLPRRPSASGRQIDAVCHV